MWFRRKKEGSYKSDNSELILTGWGALRERLLEDVLTIPFFWLWALPLSAIIQYSSDEKVNDFFVTMHGEGIALKNMASLFIVSLITTGLAMLCCPKPNGNWMKLLRAPAKAGRSMSMVTFAFMLGAAPVLGFVEGWTRMIELIRYPLLYCIIIWGVLFILDSCALQAKSWSTKELNELSTVGGAILTVVGILSPFLLYWQILQGAYSSIAS